MKIRSVLLTSALAASLGFALIAKGNRATQESSSPRMWQNAMQAEINGSPEMRDQLLHALLSEDPRSEQARWLLGQIRKDGEWVNFSEWPEQLKSSKALQEYYEIREKYGMTSQEQLELANWCRSHRLPEREQAHLTAALELSDNPNDPELRARLGYRRIDGTWRTQAELMDLRESRVANQKNLRKWQSKIQRLASQLNSQRDFVRQKAREELQAISDRTALPALVAVLGNADLESGRLLVEILAQYPSHKAAEALANVAIVSPWKVVRGAAAEQLRSRPYGAYVPKLLGTLSTPVSAKVELLVESSGVQLLEVYTRETQSTRDEIKKRGTKVIVPINRGGTTSIMGVVRDQRRLDRATINAAVEAQLQADLSQNSLDGHNDRIESLNDRVCATLTRATGVQLSKDPAEWWEWWRDYNQLTEEEKEYRVVTSDQTQMEMVEVGTPVVNTGTDSGSDSGTGGTDQGGTTGSDTGSGTPPRECLVAGTPIWTDRGPVAVEDVQVGDLVLAKHPETGELDYQPVLRTTIRKAEPVMKLTTDKGSLRATGGHTFWVSGQGWTKLRDVKVGQQFHSANGPVEVKGLETDRTEETYNLLVANVHTYFAGPDFILSHDVTVARPVDVLVPGFAQH